MGRKPKTSSCDFFYPVLLIKYLEKSQKETYYRERHGDFVGDVYFHNKKNFKEFLSMILRIQNYMKDTLKDIIRIN